MIVWSINNAPIGLRDFVIRVHAQDGSASLRNGSGPSLATHVGDLSLVDHLAHRRAAQVGAVLGADHPHPHLPDRFRKERIAARGHSVKVP